MSGTGSNDSVARSADPEEAVRVDEALERAPARGEPLGPLHRLEVREADVVVQRDLPQRAGARARVGAPLGRRVMLDRAQWPIGGEEGQTVPPPSAPAAPAPGV